MRLFIAFDPPADQRARLAGLLPDPPTDCRPVAPERMHVTMRFVGSVDKATRDVLVAGLERLELERGRAAVRGVGTFPPTGRPKVLWAGLDVDGAVRDVQERVEALCAGTGNAVRPWTPHVTLARMRGRRPRWLYDFLQRNDRIELPPFAVDRLVLYNSVPGEGGVRYDALAECRAR